jgi:uncharacterized protein (TIGR02217 family)
MGFHNVSFPARLAFGSGSGIERKVQITTLASGFEQRLSSWGQGRRRYLIGAGIRSLTDAADLLAFFEAREGALFAFRFKDFIDFKSSNLMLPPSSSDQLLGLGDGQKTSFQLTKTYGAVNRRITKPVSGSVKIAVAGSVRSSGFSVDHLTGMVTFITAPLVGQEVRAGFEFDVPVRFDTDELDLTLEGFGAGRVAAVPLLEVR